MKPLRLLVATAAILLPAGLLIACSSKETKTTAGGAKFRFQTVAATISSGKCQDPVADVTIATLGEDGKTLKLIPDGSDGSNVSCTYDDHSWNITVQGNRGDAITGFGTFGGDGMTSTDASMQFITHNTAYKTPADHPCTVSFTKKADNALLGRVNCPEIVYDLTSSTCAVTALDTDGHTPYAYFQFSDCNP